MSQFKDDFALNCGFQHQGGAMSTIASAVLETKFQFSDTHPGSSFFGLFLAKQILSLGGRLSTPWVQLNSSSPNNKEGEQNITLLKSNAKRKKEGLVRVTNQKQQKRKERHQALIRAGLFGIRSSHSNGEDRDGVSKKTTQTNLDRREKECKAFPHRSGRAFFLF